MLYIEENTSHINQQNVNVLLVSSELRNFEESQGHKVGIQIIVWDRSNTVRDERTLQVHRSNLDRALRVSTFFTFWDLEEVQEDVYNLYHHDYLVHVLMVQKLRIISLQSIAESIACNDASG